MTSSHSHPHSHSPCSPSTTPPAWSDKARTRIPRKRNRSTSATITNLTNCNTSSLDQDNDSPQGTSGTLHSMTRHEQRTHTNDYTLSPSKQIFQHFSSWSGLTNSHVSPSSDPQPPKKRRKGVAGAILSTALDAALFTSAIGYAAYNFWCGKGLEEEEATRLPKARFSRSTPSQSLLSSPPPPPYEPPEQVMEPIRMARAPRKPTSARPATNHRVYSSHPVQPSPEMSDPINFILRPNPAASMNHSFHLKVESESIERSSNSYTYIPEPINSNELGDEEYEEDDEELKAFKAQIQGLIKEGREALASRPLIPNSITRSTSSSSLHPPPLNKMTNKSSPTTTNTNPQPIVTSTDKSTQSVAQLDENVHLLQLALEKAALPSHSNWWER